MKPKKETKAKSTDLKEMSDTPEVVGPIASKAELKTFLLSIRDRMEDESAAPIYALSAMNHVMNHPDIYELLEPESKEIARDIWLRIKQSGMQVKKPALLFGDETDGVARS